MNILIGVHGSHSQPEHMRAQRETWLRDLDCADYRFFLGTALPGRIPSGNDSGPVSHEQGCDVVYLDSADGPIWDRPVNGHRTWFLNRKTEALVRYALENGYDYVFKCDDDTYVRWPEIVTGGFERHDYSGFTEPLRIGDYRWAQGGAGYWLSRRAMEIIDGNGLHLWRAEDFAVGHLLATHGIHPHHDPRYRPAVTPAELENPPAEYWTLHKTSPARMRTLYQHFHHA